jgi:hypothetical protein
MEKNYSDITYNYGANKVILRHAPADIVKRRNIKTNLNLDTKK